MKIGRGWAWIWKHPETGKIIIDHKLEKNRADLNGVKEGSDSGQAVFCAIVPMREYRAMVKEEKP